MQCDVVGQALLRTYGRFFAEFLEDLSFVRLSLLDQNTCVGLRYGFYTLNRRSFSWKLALSDFSQLPLKFSLGLE
jgi:hypothetical protein